VFYMFAKQKLLGNSPSILKPPADSSFFASAPPACPFALCSPPSKTDEKRKMTALPLPPTQQGMKRTGAVLQDVRDPKRVRSLPPAPFALLVQQPAAASAEIVEAIQSSLRAGVEHHGLCLVFDSSNLVPALEKAVHAYIQRHPQVLTVLDVGIYKEAAVGAASVADVDIGSLWYATLRMQVVSGVPRVVFNPNALSPATREALRAHSDKYRLLEIRDVSFFDAAAAAAAATTAATAVAVVEEKKTPPTPRRVVQSPRSPTPSSKERACIECHAKFTPTQSHTGRRCGPCKRKNSKRRSHSRTRPSTTDESKGEER
jgi:hypothetical protein